MKKITLTQEELEKEIKQAFICGQRNVEMMEAGLERDETKDYVNSRMRSLLNHRVLKEEQLDNLLKQEKEWTSMFDSDVRVGLALLDEIRKLNQNK
jgi:hypothetical protein